MALDKNYRELVLSFWIFPERLEGLTRVFSCGKYAERHATFTIQMLNETSRLIEMVTQPFSMVPIWFSGNNFGILLPTICLGLFLLAKGPQHPRFQCSTKPLLSQMYSRNLSPRRLWCPSGFPVVYFGGFFGKDLARFGVDKSLQ